ncbi:threonine--tRNA ligase [Rhodopirellula sp. MGV]|uniref:threonine--tRNA ligase n=1 Tax=Rhodopirellula sp. MGV TaxID=2023130 RepID=UPI000B978F31|nr:threonine--tRNA ligase [Rhodopirellula sp. MGV]OYP39102.1 threonine--tRNA ligase [Rhodopirellula sp. MGV]PNY35594.1 threonine--tRNA ligase [Rhodopirellula baltica]
MSQSTSGPVSSGASDAAPLPSVVVRLPDGATQTHPGHTTSMDIATGISEGLARSVVAAEVNGKVIDADRPLGEVAPELSKSADGELDLRLLTSRDSESLDVLRHSAAHVMARAVMRLYDGVSLAFGPTTEGGFYYDFDVNVPISEEDFPKIEAEMKKIIKDKEPFERFLLDRDEARKLCDDLDQDLKVEHIDTGLAEHATVSFYRQGEFVDLCRGPHIPDAGKIKAIKLMSVAGSHWKGDVKNRPLQRLYGTAFFDKKELKQYLHQLEEAKRRDHRVLGRQHGLFAINPDEVGQGLCLWLPKGARVRVTLEDFLRKELLQRGYDPVYSPHIGRVELYETSGHFPYYRDSQFAPLFGTEVGGLLDAWSNRLEDGSLDSDGEDKLMAAIEALGVELPNYKLSMSVEDKRRVLHDWQLANERYLLKPMNCPHHCHIFKAQARSYRQLPLRLFEFGTVYRHEQTGELNGMLRVRGLTQDDAHIFCTSDQVEEEFRATIELTKFVLQSVGLDDYRVQLSLRDPDSSKYVGSEDQWDAAEGALRGVLEQSGMNFNEEPGEAAFYGPKADFMVRDCIGRSWQLGTVQLDYNLPERFKLEYNGKDNQAHRPVMIHRAPFGSLERFTGMLIEHFAGAFPMWLSPEQVRVLPLSDKSLEYAVAVAKQLDEAGLKVTVDSSGGKVQAKIRNAQLDLVNYMAVVGPKEAETGQIALRDRIDGDLGSMPIAQAVARLTEEVKNRTVRQAVKVE